MRAADSSANDLAITHEHALTRPCDFVGGLSHSQAMAAVMRDADGMTGIGSDVEYVIDAEPYGAIRSQVLDETELECLTPLIPHRGITYAPTPALSAKKAFPE